MRVYFPLNFFTFPELSFQNRQFLLILEKSANAGNRVKVQDPANMKKLLLFGSFGWGEVLILVLLFLFSYFIHRCIKSFMDGYNNRK